MYATTYKPIYIVEIFIIMYCWNSNFITLQMLEGRSNTTKSLC